ncbi:hypothetical protein HQQ88_08200 [Curtobacterium sp. VKM Ac-2861]|uniref:terminase large subunit domain-containing protein n=1 Tax=Curtobacterium sp. VKM Ac-2861 TaxID=2739016 RepID=UPI001566DD7F|nr:hypothetical protein [Curtobacterium sp. VKM Ac-2861]
MTLTAPTPTPAPDAGPAFDVSDVAPWPPTRYTAPLTERHPSLWERYRETLQRAWWVSNAYCLEEWQERLLHAITELDAFGNLRYREVLISLGRQNGKTEIAAALGLLFMVAKRAPQVIGIASSAEQARLVYKRAYDVVARYGPLTRRFARLTDTRGLSTATGGSWELKASKSAALQGLPIDLGAIDEVHLLKPELWTDLVNGTGDRENCMVAGITTAGDDDSALLLRLYDRDDAPGTGFGRFIWEAPEPRVPDDDAVLARWLAMANPGIASGRRKVSIAVSAVRGMPPGEAVRYRLNRFVSGSDNGYMTPTLWSSCAGAVHISRPVITIDRTPDWSYASIVASSKAADGVIETEVIESMPHPTVEKLAEACQRLYKHSPATYVVDGYSLRALGDQLKRNGLPVRYMTLGDEVSAASMAYAKVAGGRVRHAGDELLTRQLPNVIRKAHGDQYKLARAGAGGIDAVLATVRGIYVAEVSEEAGIQLF